MADQPPVAAIFLLVACLLPLGYVLAYGILWVLSAILAVIWPVLAIGAVLLTLFAALFVFAVAASD